LKETNCFIRIIQQKIQKLQSDIYAEWNGHIHVYMCLSWPHKPKSSNQTRTSSIQSHVATEFHSTPDMHTQKTSFLEYHLNIVGKPQYWF